MTEITHFGGVFYVALPHKLSTSVSSIAADTYSADSALFERGSRKVSSLANGIASTYSDKTNRGGIQESMTKKARGLDIHAGSKNPAFAVHGGQSAEQPSLAERRAR